MKIYDDKNDYLYRTFAKNKQQKENYVINAIYSRINCKELKPVTQQCIRFEGTKKYYRIDLFFPQLNIGIECDEVYHKNQILRDEKRTEDIKDKLNSIVLQKNKYILYRIDATLSYNELYDRINKVALEIKGKCKKIKWLTFDEQLKEIRKRGYRFIGVFKIEKVTKREHIHKKISNKIKLDDVKMIFYKQK